MNFLQVGLILDVQFGKKLLVRKKSAEMEDVK